MARNRRAFTLVEILVVVSILSLLLVILFPAFSMAKRDIRRTTCKNNMKNIVMAISSYANRNNDWLPPPYYGSQPFGTWNKDKDTGTNPQDTWKLLNESLQTSSYSVLQCPADQADSPTSGTTKFAQNGYSYMYPASINYGTSQYTTFDCASIGIYYVRGNNVVTSGDKITTASYWAGSRKVCLLDGDALLTGQAGERPARGFWHDYSWKFSPGSPDDYSRALVQVHAGFLDGHVTTIELNDYVPGGSCPIHPNGTCPGASKDHEYN